MAAACIFRVNRTFDGVVEGVQGRPYICRSGRRAQKTSIAQTKITCRITAGIGCDESAPVMPAGQLQARGSTTVRADGFAHFSGRFKIVRLEQGQIKEVYFVGIIYLASRIGSHQALGEECDEKDHVEGWLTGTGRGKLEKYSLRVALVAKGALPSSVLPDASINRMSGVLVRRG